MTALKDLRLVFMGTPDFAVASLKKLQENGCNIVGVITAPDKPAGRGLTLQQSAVKQYAVEQQLNVLQPEKLKNPEFLETLRQLKADVQVVVAFRMLPELVWNMPPKGTINVHGSLLPQYRGAAPINWAIINGEKETGVTTFRLQHAIDTGDILLQTVIPIHENETAGELHDVMKEAGAELLLQTLRGICENSIEPVPQQIGQDIKHAPKLSSTTGEINWNASVDEVHNLIRGLSPVPAAYTFLNGKKLKIFRTVKLKEQNDVEPGNFTTDHKTFLRFACTDGCIDVLELQAEGKKKLSVVEFLRGYRFT